MHINTRLSVKDILRAYKEMAGFFKTYPSALIIMVAVYGFLALIPDALLPIKMAAYAVAITAATCVTTALYRTGEWRQVVSELKFQQRLLIPALLAIIALSVVGYAVAEQLLPLFTEPSAITLPMGSSQAVPDDQLSVLIVATLATGLICISQVMPYVLAHFCIGLSLSKQQGEQIWVALMLNSTTLLAFSPLALATPLLLFYGVQATEAIMLVSALYCVFLLFIVFNIQKATPLRNQRLVPASS